MSATEPARELMRMAATPQHCADCPMFAVVRDAVTLALLKGGLGQVLTGQPIRVPETLPSPAPPGGHHVIARRTGQAERDATERVARIRGVMHACLATIDRARKAITATARDGDGMTGATQVEVRRYCGIIQKEVQTARERLAAVR